MKPVTLFLGNVNTANVGQAIIVMHNQLKTAAKWSIYCQPLFNINVNPKEECNMKFKIKAVPFLLGSWGYSYFWGGTYEVSMTLTVFLLLLVVTRQVDLI